MPRTQVCVAAAAIAFAFLLLPVRARASQIFDPASFGTGVYFGAPPGGQFSLQGTTAFKALSTENMFLPNVLAGGYNARARADFQGFEVGGGAFADADYDTPPVFVSGGARAYTGLTVSTDTPVQLTGSVVLEGTFEATGNDSASLLLAVLDIDGNELAEADLDANTTGLLVGCDPPGTCTDRTVLPSSPSWSLTIPFTLPTLVDTGIFVVLDSFAEDTTIDGLLVSADFFGTATLNFTPPPGVTVTLATGQTFVGAPEPGSVALQGAGILVLAALRHRQVR
jgi:hypothetical protein